jgi:alginate O-acetyltransferase complex protein AlgI
VLFNTIDFAIFLPIVFSIYWFVLRDSVRRQNILLLIASYIFYGWWDWKFLILIAASTIIDYVIGLSMEYAQKPERRKTLLAASIFFNLGVLGFFKYFNFFIENFVAAFSFLGFGIESNSLNIILPVGISFYTFQTMSYTIDVYRKNLKPTRDFVSFSAFVSFFPQLVAGPIERASNLLPQFYKARLFAYDQAANGMRQILWGLFKKVVIADNCATYANLIFNDSANYNGSTLLVGSIFFAFQIYGDFSGYSDIAIGVSRLFGFNLMQNFAFPYFSRDIAEFWRRWHISLSTWFRDYVYIPLGGSKGSTLLKVRNTFVIFIVSGFWHGANWTFIIWGALNAVYFLPLLLSNKNRRFISVVGEDDKLTFGQVLRMSGTFGLVVLSWVFFRSDSVWHALTILNKIFSFSLFEVPLFYNRLDALVIAILIFVMLSLEWIGRKRLFALDVFLLNSSRIARYSFYLCLVFLILIFRGAQQDFIYFQF